MATITLISLGIMTVEEQTAFHRQWRPMTAAEELAIHNGYISFASPDVMEMAEGIYVRRVR